MTDRYNQDNDILLRRKTSRRKKEVPKQTTKEFDIKKFKTSVLEELTKSIYLYYSF